MEKNQVEAAEWMRKAATQGYFRAQLFLGAWYADGLGVPKDLVEAFAWLNLGVQGLQREHSDQPETSAELSKKEFGVTSQATSIPSDEATLKLFEQLKTELTPEQITEAKKRAAAFTQTTNRVK